MVLACKIFVADDYMSVEEAALKLKDFKLTSNYLDGEQEVELVSEIKDLEIRDGTLGGIFSIDTPISIYSRGERRLIPRTFESFFRFFLYNGKLLLLVFEKKERANNVANQLSKILFLIPGRILEVRIHPDILRKYHEEHMEDAKVLFFDDVDIPNISKLSLYGSGLANTALYSEYLIHGNLWYIVVKSKKFGYVTGVTRNGIIVSFTKIDVPDLSNFVKAEIFPLLGYEKNA